MSYKISGGINSCSELLPTAFPVNDDNNISFVVVVVVVDQSQRFPNMTDQPLRIHLLPTL
jgi:hypothetical protein